MLQLLETITLLQIQLMKKATIYLTLFLLVGAFVSCKKDDPEMAIGVNYPIANVGDLLSFSITNGPNLNVGVRWEMGDGTAPYSGSTFTGHTYNAPGIYTVKAQVFLENETVALQRDITIEQP